MEPTERSALEREALACCDRKNFDQATTTLIEGYGPELLAFIFSLVPDEEDASDVFSVVCERIWRALPAFERRSTLRTWLYQLARNAAFDHHRSEKRHKRRHLPLSQHPAAAEMQERIRTSTISALRSQTKSRILELRAKLPLEDQTLLILRVDRGLDWNEVAMVFRDGEPADEETERRESARLRKRFQSVKDKLRELAEQEGIINTDQ